MSLKDELIKGLLPEEEKKQTTALYAGGFKPPTSGHFEVVQQALKENPEIDEFIIFIGAKDRDGISQTESLLIWEIYNTYLPFKVILKPTSVPPIKAVYNFAKEHPTREILWVIGAREGNEEDFKDISGRTSSISKYPNLELRTIITTGGVSGTAARNAAKVSLDKFRKFTPTQLTDDETQEVFDIVSGKVNENQPQDGKSSPFGSGYNKVEESKFNHPKSIQQHLIENINEISLSKENAVEINGDLTGGTFTIGDIPYEYSIKNTTNPYKDLGLFYNIQFTPKGEVTSIPKGGKENYIKILSTMYKIIVDFIETKKPEYVGISSLDNSGDKNYHTVYNRLTTNNLNLIPGYFRKESNLIFNSPQGKGRFIVLKRKEELNENASYTKTIDLKQEIAKLTKHMIDKGMNIQPLPKLVFKNGNSENAKQFLGKTAYYDPNSMSIVLYTEGRHPKDIVRSYSHEMVHHTQNLENRLGNITTTNTQEDGALDKLEQEANLTGTMTFRNWTDSLQESSISNTQKPISLDNNVNEGRYDKSTNQLSKIAFESFKYIHDRGNKKGEFKYTVGPDDEDIFSDQFEFDFEGYVEIAEDEYVVDGGANAGFDDSGEEVTPLLSINFKIPKNPNWQEISLDIKDVIRHELEHLTQDGENLKGGVISDDPKLERPSKYMKDDQLLRDLINSDALPKSQYFTLEKEVDAMLQGLYFKAKKSKTPFKSVILDYFNKSNLTPKEQSQILNIWRKRRKSLSLPIFEKIVENKIQCDRCSWTWNIKDGGDDLFICHKCGYNNTPINEETLLEEEDRLMAEIVNPDGERFKYKESSIKGLYTYKDSRDNLYFARIFYQKTINPYFEFKTGWFEDNDLSKPKYEPQLPPNTTGIDNLKRRNTVAKIYRDEIIPYFKEKSTLSNTLFINPISDLRYTFSKRLVQNHTPENFDIQYNDKDKKYIKILSKKINEKKIKDPFGINAYAMELGRLREDETEYQIYCDLDGVLADFERGYKELTGIDLQGEFKPEGEEFWGPISKAGVGFWAGLKWMPDGQQLWDYIKPYKPKLLSAPSKEDSSRIGKAVWVKHKIPGTKLILRYASHKKELASPTSILIDDRIKNIEDWESAGGVGILHTSATDTISQLKKLKL